MPKASKGKKFYAVQKGRQTGVFLTWEDCERQTKGYSGAKYQSFTNAADAEAFISGTLSKDTGSAPSTSSSPGDAVSHAKRKKRTMPRDVEAESEHDVVYCDGACKGNGQVGSIAGVGVWWEENDPRNIAERCPGDQTNNRAELIAIVRMLETTPKSKRPLLIKTDSQYCIKSFLQWLPKWKRNNFRTAGGAPVKNVEIIKYVSALLEARALVGQPVRMEYVKGHSGDRGNDGADAQANKGALLPPVPERDWAKAKQELLKRLKEERRLSEDQPTPVPLDVNVLEQSTNQPHKVRKVNHDLPFSRLSSVPASTEPSNSEQPSTDSLTAQIRSPSPPHATSPPPPLPIIEVSSSPPRETGPSQARPSPSTPPSNADPAQPELESEPETVKVTSHMDSQPSTDESDKLTEVPKTPVVRKHGVGLFTTTPPPNARFVRKFSTLPSKSQGAKESEPVPQIQEKIEKSIEEPIGEPMVMSVDAADVDLNVNESKESEPVPQDQEENEKSIEEPMVMNVDTADVGQNEAKESEEVPKDQENTEQPIEKPMAMNLDASGVDLNETKESEPVQQDWEEIEKLEAKESEPVKQDQEENEKLEAKELEPMQRDREENEKPIAMSVDTADVDMNGVKESELVPRDQENIEQPIEKPMAMSVGTSDVDLNGVKESEPVSQDQENTEQPIEKPMTISVDASNVDLNGAEELEPVPEGQENTEQPIERPMAMSVDASDVDLNDYLDCIDDDDDPFGDL